MLTDKSENYIETWRFLDRRIRDILEYGKYINTVHFSSLFVLLNPKSSEMLQVESILD